MKLFTENSHTFLHTSVQGPLGRVEGLIITHQTTHTHTLSPLFSVMTCRGFRDGSDALSGLCSGLMHKRFDLSEIM